MNGVSPLLPTCLHVLHVENTEFVILRIISVLIVLALIIQNNIKPNTFY